MPPLIRSTCMLIAANLLAIAIAIATDMQLRELMLVYWTQSIFIGISFAIRIRGVQRSLVERLHLEEPSKHPTPGIHRSQFRAFVLWYGVFHGAYLSIIATPPGLPEDTLAGAAFWVCAFAFAANHAYSMRANLAQDRLGNIPMGWRERELRLNTYYMLPFARIAPMHIALISGAMLDKEMSGLVLFCALKTLVDAGMHVKEHRMLRRRAA